MPKVIDMTDQRFGHLRVIEQAGVTEGGIMRWRVICDCGTDFTVVGSSLRNGSTISCGCKTGVRMAGERFGRFFVLERHGSSRDKKAVFRCMCDCGNECIVRGTHLRNGTASSCGCAPKGKLTEFDVKKIKKSHDTNVQLANKFNVSISTISLIRNGKIWVHV